MVVSPIATCSSGVSPSTHWCRYLTYAQATCTVWLCFLGGGGRCIRVGGGRCICVGGGRCIRVGGGSGCSYGVVVLGKCIGISQRKY